MLNKLPLEFFLASRKEPVEPGGDTWKQPLPLSRRPLPAAPAAVREKTVAYGDFFTAVGRFLEKDHYRAVKTVLEETRDPGVTLEQVRGLAVFLVKHGEFYHPARVVAATSGGDISFVINVAVSKSGRDHIKREFELLGGLYREFETPVLPRVYDLVEIPCRENLKLPMFSAQWLEGFCEFHLTGKPAGGMSPFIVWDPCGNPFHLTEQQAESACRQIASILTRAYNFFTFEQIRAWHHAAGDFILKPLDADRVDVRLITVREYAPHIADVDPDPAALVEGLMLFFLNLTIRNRIDRLNGIGALAWADDYTLRGTIEGFFSGLDVIVRKLDLPRTFADEFKNYILAHPPAALSDLFSALVDRIPETSPEHDFVKNRIGRHADLFRAFLGPGESAGLPGTDTI